jgi:hypothetical protein
MPTCLEERLKCGFMTSERDLGLYASDTPMNSLCESFNISCPNFIPASVPRRSEMTSDLHGATNQLLFQSVLGQSS